MKLRFFVLFPLVGLLSACGGGGPVGPDPVPTTMPVGGSLGTSSLTFVDGGTGIVASGVSVMVAGKATQTTDASGQVVIEPPAGMGTLFDAVLDGKFLPRNTLIRSLTEPTTLWPVSSGYPADFFEELVYNKFMPGRRLTRPTATTAYLKLPPSIAEDAQAKAVHEQAASRISAATGGMFWIVVSDNPPLGAMVIEAKLDVTSPFFALTPLDFAGNRIVGGRPTYRTIQIARILTTVVHELGHVLGLGHDDKTVPGIMATSPRVAYEDFTAPELLAIRMMFQRRPGTEWPDNDRNAQAMSGFRGTITIACN